MIKLPSIKNISSREITRNYTLVFLLLTILISASLYSIDTRNQDLQQIINKQFTVNSVMKELADISRSRREIMTLILNEDDPFNRDDLIQKYSSQASEFMKHREKISLLNLSKTQTDIFNATIKIVSETYIYQMKTISLANEGDMLNANKVFSEKILPKKILIRDAYDEVVRSMHRQSKIEIDNAQRTSRNAIVIIVALLALLLILAVWVQFIAAKAIHRYNMLLISNNEELELTVKERTKELKLARNEADRANNAKSQFLFSMSHELRTPLNAVLGFSQLLEMGEKDEQKKQNIHEIIGGGNHLLELINQILDLAKIESGNVELSIENHSLNIILNYALVMIQPFADKHSIKIDDKVSSLPDTNINVDELRFKQVLLNLLSNAIKYNSEKGTVTIDCSSNDNNMLCLSIIDTGKGLTPEQRSNLFVPFERFGAANSHIEGTGLGLVITKDLIELMGGTISVDSEVGKGSRFIIQVPLS